MRTLRTVEDGVVTYDICDELDQLRIENQQLKDLYQKLLHQVFIHKCEEGNK